MVTYEQLKECWTLREELAGINRIINAMDKLSLSSETEGDEEKNKRIKSRMFYFGLKLDDAMKKFEFAKSNISSAVWKADNLTMKEKQVLFLRYSQCLPFKEIAADMRYSESMIYKLHRKAVEKFCDEENQGEYPDLWDL